MSSVLGSSSVFDNEIAFCKVYTQKAKQELERVFLRHRISYFVEWGQESLWQKLFPAKDGRISCTIRINKADFFEARELVRGIRDVRVRNIDGMEEHDAVKDLARKKELKDVINRKKPRQPVIHKTAGGKGLSPQERQGQRAAQSKKSAGGSDRQAGRLSRTENRPARSDNRSARSSRSRKR